MVTQKEDSRDGLIKLLPIIGSVVGGFFGPVGSAAGGALGGKVAEKKQEQGAVSGVQGQPMGASDPMAPMGPSAPPSTPSGQGAIQTSAMQRRMDKINDDPLTTLNKAQIALKYQPEDVRKQYEPIVGQALINAQREAQKNQYGGIS